VEPVFGQIKGVRDFRRFLLRGLTKVRSEWGLGADSQLTSQREGHQGVGEDRPVFLGQVPSPIVKALGLEPRTYGLKVRCSTS
jgi:hypothetical protein